jgi:hypothetical protein
MPSRAIGISSEILWHFTGGPRWNDQAQRQDARPRPPQEAYDALKAILRSKELRVGKYHEVVKVTVPRRERIIGPGDKQRLGPPRNVSLVVRTAPVCCVADIPLALLDGHSNRYGRFAIGFRRDALIAAGFNPVFYTLHDRPIIHSLNSAILALYELANQLSVVQGEAEDAAAHAGTLAESTSNDDVVDLASEIQELADTASSDVTDVQKGIKERLDELITFMAFIKTFAEEEFKTIFHEREWRSTSTFKFEYDQLALVIASKAIGGHDYFSDLCRNLRQSLPRSVPIVPWEDLL